MTDAISAKRSLGKTPGGQIGEPAQAVNPAANAQVRASEAHTVDYRGRLRREPLPHARGPRWLVVHVVDIALLLAAVAPFVFLLAMPVLAALVTLPAIVWILWAALLVWLVLFLAVQCRLARPGAVKPPVQSDADAKPSIAVIGAGPVGMVVVKECKARGLPVECFEKAPGLGGVYRFDASRPGGVWQSTLLTSSPWVTAFSDHPPASLTSKQDMAWEYLDYLNDYAERFDLAPHIKFGLTVTRVSRSDNGRWLVRIEEETGQTEEKEFDRVAVCSGVHQKHRPIPDLPGKDGFRGEIRDMTTYKSPDDLKGKRVLVVGLGESGADVADEVSQVAAAAWLSVRRGKFVIPRTNPITGMSNDYDTNRMRYSTPLALRDWLMLLKRRLCVWAGASPDTELRAKLALSAQAGPLSQTATKSDDFIYAVLDGKLGLKGMLQGFDGDQVVFEDGSREIVDVVILAHGFIPDFPFLDIGQPINHPGELYLNMFDPDIGSNMAFCGFSRPAIGSIPPTGELQARYFALLASGERALPDADAMQCDIERVHIDAKGEFPAQPRPSVVVHWIPYMDRLATAIGCKPNPWKLLMKPSLLWRVMAGPMTGMVYRLHGDGADPAVEGHIRKLQRGHGLIELFTLAGLHFWIWPWSAVSRDARLRSANSFV